MNLKTGDIDPFHVHLTMERKEFNNSSTEEWVPVRTRWNVDKSLVGSVLDQWAVDVEDAESHGWNMRVRATPAIIGRQTAWTVTLAGEDEQDLLAS